jgi:hypothetical protein
MNKPFGGDFAHISRLKTLAVAGVFLLQKLTIG